MFNYTKEKLLIDELIKDRNELAKVSKEVMKLKKILLNASEEVNNLQELLIIANEETIKLNQQLNEAIRVLYQSEEEPKNILS